MKLYGIIGKPLGHTFSRGYFSGKFAREGTDAAYENFQIDSASEIFSVIEKNPSLEGFNVTIPYKQDILLCLDETDPVAAEIGAVNCVRVRNVGGKPHMKGYNTDAEGFEISLKAMLGDAVVYALVLGTGGASKAVCYVLRKMGIPYITLSRSGNGALSYNELTREIISDNKLIINTTPLGSLYNISEAPDIPYDFIGEGHYLFDLVYNPPLTEFLRRGKNRGATVKNGYEMLVRQAEAAYIHFTE